MELFSGRPLNIDNRLEREKRVYDLLDSVGIDYMRVDHEPADNMEACLAIDEVLEATICKNLFLCNRQKTNFYLVMMPGDKPFKTKEVSGQIGCARLSFAGPEEMLEYLDIEPGSVSVMGLMNDKNNMVRLLVDEDILDAEYIGCHPCVNTSSLRLKTKDVFGPVLKAMNHDMTVIKLIGE
ncbi:MAG: prolyl-tRNA synthetase associated domain-containing protein [Lachnospiraceae bacterium]|nr:prolyl-tRNA synthetase associated domain-containing protein [Lachnospiraceae bacterium]